jgi:hypothetical protein
MTARLPELDWVDERLKAWAHYFKDRHKYSSCGSIEKLFRATSDVCESEGWGEPSPPVIAPVLDLHSVLQAHCAVQALPKSYKWAITYAFCYPYLERWRVLKLMKKYTGRRFTWKEYLDQVDIGRCRVAAYLAQPMSLVEPQALVFEP